MLYGNCVQLLRTVGHFFMPKIMSMVPKPSRLILIAVTYSFHVAQKRDFFSGDKHILYIILNI